MTSAKITTFQNMNKQMVSTNSKSTISKILILHEKNNFALSTSNPYGENWGKYNKILEI